MPPLSWRNHAGEHPPARSYFGETRYLCTLHPRRLRAPAAKTNYLSGLRGLLRQRRQEQRPVAGEPSHSTHRDAGAPSCVRSTRRPGNSQETTFPRVLSTPAQAQRVPLAFPWEPRPSASRRLTVERQAVARLSGALELRRGLQPVEKQSRGREERRPGGPVFRDPRSEILVSLRLYARTWGLHALRRGGPARRGRRLSLTRSASAPCHPSRLRPRVCAPLTGTPREGGRAPQPAGWLAPQVNVQVAPGPA